MTEPALYGRDEQELRRRIDAPAESPKLAITIDGGPHPWMQLQEAIQRFPRGIPVPAGALEAGQIKIPPCITRIGANAELLAVDRIIEARSLRGLYA